MLTTNRSQWHEFPTVVWVENSRALRKMKQNFHEDEQHCLLPSPVKPGLWWSQGSEPKPPGWIYCLTHKTLYSHCILAFLPVLSTSVPSHSPYLHLPTSLSTWKIAPRWALKGQLVLHPVLILLHLSLPLLSSLFPWSFPHLSILIFPL